MLPTNILFLSGVYESVILIPHASFLPRDFFPSWMYSPSAHCHPLYVFSLSASFLFACLPSFPFVFLSVSLSVCLFCLFVLFCFLVLFVCLFVGWLAGWLVWFGFWFGLVGLGWVGFACWLAGWLARSCVFPLLSLCSLACLFSPVFPAVCVKPLESQGACLFLGFRLLAGAHIAVDCPTKMLQL